jgi:hypothetical protein
LCILLHYSRLPPNVREGFNPTLKEIRRFGREEIVKPILALSFVVERNSEQIVGEKAEEVVIR